MKIVVLLFAGVRETAGMDRITLELPDGATVADATAELVRQIPALVGRIKACSMSVDMVLASPDQKLRDGAEMAVLPAVSGG